MQGSGEPVALGGGVVRDHRQLAGADGTGAGWAASISHSLAPARITSVCRNASDTSAGIFLILESC